MRRAAWPVAQAAVAAGIAWFIAHVVLGHPQPVFATIAAVVALAANVGGRGRQAIEMLVGVIVGVVVGEIAVTVVGTGAAQIVIVAAVAMMVAAALDYNPLPLIQAGASAVIVVALQSPESGGERLVDALIGGAVALLMSQVLFTPSPVSILAGAHRSALRTIADGLNASSRALLDGDAVASESAVEYLRGDGRGSLESLEAARDTTSKLSRRTLRGRREARSLQRLDCSLGEVDLLLCSALALARSANELLTEYGAAPGRLYKAVGELAAGVGALADGTDSEEARSRAVSTARQAKHRIRDAMDESYRPLTDGIRSLAGDLERLAAT